jgi:hypothetical protein
VDCICCAVGFTGLPYSLASDASRSRLSVVRVTPSRRLEVEKPSLVCLVIAVLIVDCTQEEGTKLMLTLLYSPHTSRTLSLEPTIPLSSVCYLFHLVCDGFEVLVRFLVLHVLRLFVKIDLHHHAMLPQTLKTALLLLTPSKTHVLSTGTYCSVTALMTSCDTMPPVRAAILCSSAPPARALHTS